MKQRIVFVLILLLSVVGCGSFSHHQQTYYVKEMKVEANSRPVPRLIAQIVPSTENSGVPMLYQSRKWGAPYSVLLSAHSKKSVCTHFLLYSFIVRSEGEVITNKSFSNPVKLDLCGVGNYNYYHLYKYNLGNSLVFEKGRKVELEVTYGQADVPGKTTIFMKGIGEEEKSKSSLWDAYMGV